MKMPFSITTPLFNLRGDLSPDKMKLFIDVEPVEGAKVQRDDLVTALKAFIPTENVDLGVLADIAKHLNQAQKAEKRRILKGKEAEDGADGKLVLLVKKYTGKGEFKIDPTGRAHYAEVKLFDNVQTGQAVARLYPPKPGVDGKDAVGGVVRAKMGKPLKVSVDKTLQLEKKDLGKDGFEKLVALKPGLVTEDGGKLIISDLLEIKDDVDYHCGNIDFIGAVKVRGDVMQDFTVKAKKGVEVQGCVRGGSVLAAEGDVVVRGFVYGKSGSKIITGKNFTAAGVEHSHVETVGDVVLAKEARATYILTQSAVFLDKGRLVGGICLTVRGLQAKFIGNDVGFKTVAMLCSDVEAGTEYVELLVKIESYERAADMIKLHLGPLAEDAKRVEALKAQHRSRITPLLDKLRQVKEGHHKLLAKKAELLAKAKVTAQQRVNFHGFMYQGVEILAQEHKFCPAEDLKGPSSLEYNFDTKQFNVAEYKVLEPLARPEEDKKQRGK